MTETTLLPISGFIAAMRDRYAARAALSEEQALVCAFNTLEAWEQTFHEEVELTTDCAHEIVDSDLEHWEAE